MASHAVRFISDAMRKAPLLNLSLAGYPQLTTNLRQPNHHVNNCLDPLPFDVGIAPWLSTFNPLTIAPAGMAVEPNSRSVLPRSLREQYDSLAAPVSPYLAVLVEELRKGEAPR
jgi:hypothetical protein